MPEETDDSVAAHDYLDAVSLISELVARDGCAFLVSKAMHGLDYTAVNHQLEVFSLPADVRKLSDERPGLEAFLQDTGLKFFFPDPHLQGYNAAFALKQITARAKAYDLSAQLDIFLELDFVRFRRAFDETLVKDYSITIESAGISAADLRRLARDAACPEEAVLAYARLQGLGSARPTRAGWKACRFPLPYQYSRFSILAARTASSGAGG